MREMLSLGVAVIFSLLFAGCPSICDSSTCSGCCRDDVCYQSGCGTGGDGGAVGGGAGGGSGSCAAAGEGCATKACCAVDSEGDALTCLGAGSPTCKATCGTGGDACNASTPCCTGAGRSYGYSCDRSHSRCELCNQRGTKCYEIGDCCPGLNCATKVGFPGYLECQ